MIANMSVDGVGMRIDHDKLSGVLMRLKRAQGQLGGIIRMI